MNSRFLILAEGAFSPLRSKTANACIRYTPEHVVAVIDSTRAGDTAQDVLGFGGSIPVVASLAEGLARKPNALLIGIAPPGGQLPPSWRALILDAIDHRRFSRQQWVPELQHAEHQLLFDVAVREQGQSARLRQYPAQRLPGAGIL